MAKLSKLLKKYKVDKILTYHQLPPDKDGKILFGWKEVNELPENQDLILSRPPGKKKGDITISTRRDYVLYFQSMVGLTIEEAVADPDNQKLSNLVVEKDFLNAMAKLLLKKKDFVWNVKTQFLYLKDIID